VKNKQGSNKNSLFRVGLMIFGVIAAVVALFFLLYKFSYIMSGVGKIISILQPIVVGLIIAYLVNPMTNFFTKHINRLLKKMTKKDKDFPKLSLYLGIAVSLIIFIIIIFVLVCAIIPSFVTSITDFVRDFSGRWESFITWVDSTFTGKNSLFNNFYNSLPNDIKLTVDKVFNTSDWFAIFEANAGKFITAIYSGVINVATFLADFVIGIVVAVYALSNKRLFKAQIKKMLYAFFNKKTVNFVFDVSKKSNEIFLGFINGKLISALIVGIICFIGVSIMRMPYPMLITVIITVTDLIPIFGPYIGTIPCAFLLLLYDPMKCVYFVLFIIALQMVEGNIISPKILGDSTGISAFWVVFAIVLGGGLFGIVGMLLSVPTFAVIHYILKRIFEHFLRKKNLPCDTSAYAGSGGLIIEEAKDEGNEQEPADKTEQTVV